MLGMFSRLTQGLLKFARFFFTNDRAMKLLDKVIVDFDNALRVMTGHASASRPSPALQAPDGVLSAVEQRHSAGLMRINHVGEVCAQALYDAQGRFAQSDAIKRQFATAGREEEDHLAWTAERLRDLGSHISLLNPLWYVGSYVIGAVAARMGDEHSLGFVAETERQVEVHLSSHLGKLPLQDTKSRAIIEKMRDDEIAHGNLAKALGAEQVPLPVQKTMQIMSKVMTTLAYYI